MPAVMDRAVLSIISMLPLSFRAEREILPFIRKISPHFVRRNDRNSVRNGRNREKAQE
jgi:hypothetical protein